jgi:hypothetical protein
MQQQAEGQSYSPFERVYMCRKAVFPGGHAETLLVCKDRFKPLPGEAKAMFELRANRGAYLNDEDSPEERAERSRRVAVARAKKELRWAILSIQADRLLTLTWRENITDRKKALAQFNRFRRMVLARFPGWVYVAVIEHQKRGAIHLHLAVRGYQNVKYMRACWWSIVGKGDGNVDVAKRKRFWRGRELDTWAAPKIAAYMAKYMGEDFDVTPKGAKRFFGSKDRAKPEVVRWWLQVKTDAEAYEMVYRATVGGKVIGVRQWASADGSFYLVSGPIDDSAPPF